MDTFSYVKKALVVLALISLKTLIVKISLTSDEFKTRFLDPLKGNLFLIID